MSTKTQEQQIDERAMAEIRRLVKASQNGDLRARADADNFSGDTAEIMRSLNTILDEALTPVNAQVDALERMVAGDLSARITADFKGDHNRGKNALNNVADIASKAIVEVRRLIDASKQGELKARTEAQQFVGDWQELMGGINTILNEALAPVNVQVETLERMAAGDLSARITADLKGDHNRGKSALNNVADIAGKAMLEVQRMIEASRQGDLQARAQVQSFVGDWKELMDGINTILNEALAPVKVQANVLESMASGDLNARITADFKGDHNRIKQLINDYQDYNQQVVEDIVQLSQELAEGNLNVAPQAEYRGDFTQIRGALETAITGLNNTMQQTVQVVEQVAQSIEQVRSVSQDLAANAEEQSSAVEEVTSNLEETDSQIRANAESAKVANQVVSDTATVANVGQQKMQQMTVAMKSIADSSQEISKIIKVIDEIAFQTNLLALNAAVEAARAGQHGRGFAVVAQEVRNLAGRSAKAARETSELIEDSNRRVTGGVTMVNDTAASLTEIVGNVVKVKDLVAEIAAASDEQAKGIGQINSAVMQVNEGTQSNSQQSEELASTADELGNLADRLREEIARFQLRKMATTTELFNGLPEGLTPELLQQIARMIQSQSGQSKPKVNGNGHSHGNGNGKGAKALVGTHTAQKNGHSSLKSLLDNDDRGYGQF